MTSELLLAVARWCGQLTLHWLASCPRRPELRCAEVPACPPCPGCPSCPGGQAAPAIAVPAAEPGLLRLLVAVALIMVAVLTCFGAGALCLFFCFRHKLHLEQQQQQQYGVAAPKAPLPTGRRSRLNNTAALDDEPSRKVGLGPLRRRESVASADDNLAGGVYGASS